MQVDRLLILFFNLFAGFVVGATCDGTQAASLVNQPDRHVSTPSSDLRRRTRCGTESIIHIALHRGDGVYGIKTTSRSSCGEASLRFNVGSRAERGGLYIDL